jgi:hypothetical protein
VDSLGFGEDVVLSKIPRKQISDGERHGLKLSAAVATEPVVGFVVPDEAVPTHGEDFVVDVIDGVAKDGSGVFANGFDDRGNHFDLRCRTSETSKRLEGGVGLE